MKKIVALAVLVAASGGLAGTSWGDPHATPTGWTGACNMVVAWPDADPYYPVDHGVAVGVQGSTGGMQTAMTRNLRGNGDYNMNRVCP